MQVQGHLVAKVVHVAEEALRIREKLLLPGVAGPADVLFEFILLAFAKGPGLVPVHIHDHYVNRDVHLSE